MQPVNNQGTRRTTRRLPRSRRRRTVGWRLPADHQSRQTDRVNLRADVVRICSDQGWPVLVLALLGERYLRAYHAELVSLGAGPAPFAV